MKNKKYLHIMRSYKHFFQNGFMNFYLNYFNDRILNT